MIALLRHWRIIAATAALAGAFFALWHISLTYQSVNDLKATVAQQAASLAQTEKVVSNVHQSAKQDQTIKAILSADLAVANGRLDRLHSDLAAIASGDTATIASADAKTLAGLFAECAGEAVWLAGEADSLAAQVIGLQGYIRAIGVAE